MFLPSFISYKQTNAFNRPRTTTAYRASWPIRALYRTQQRRADVINRAGWACGTAVAAPETDSSETAGHYNWRGIGRRVRSPPIGIYARW